MLRAGRAGLPVLIQAEPLAPDDPDAASAHPKTNDEGFHRMWATALLCRTLDGYDAVVRLHAARLDTEARAHCRIAFEHMLSFAWVVSKPEDVERPLRIAQYGLGFVERQRAEMAEQIELSQGEPHLRSTAIAVNRGPLEPPPRTQELCRELDEEVALRVGVPTPGASESFSVWFSYLYRGASAFVHPSSAGIEPLIEQVPGGFQVTSSRTTPDRMLEVVAAQLTATLLIARESAPWLLGDNAG
jgi:hypothetical protein